MRPVSEDVRLLETMTYQQVGECVEANAPLLLPVGAVEQHGPHLTYDVFPPTQDILWPNGIGNSAVPASAELGRQLVELLVDRIGRILDDEFPDG